MVKDSTRSKLLALRDRYGLDVAVSVAKSSLTISTSDGEFKKQFNGEICETVLEMKIQEILKKHADWFYVKSLVLPDADGNNPEFLTEIDFVLFTPYCVYCIECKSYAGDKELVDAGTIKMKNGHQRDVYKQNRMHLDVLDKLICPFSLTEEPVYQMILFDFSKGRCVDKRGVRARKEFPLANEQTFAELLKVRKAKVWDITGLASAKVKLEKFSERAHDKHLAYVKKLHKEGDLG